MKKLRDVKVGDIVLIEGCNFLVLRSRAVGRPLGSPYKHWLLESTSGSKIEAPDDLMVECQSKK